MRKVFIGFVNFCLWRGKSALFALCQYLSDGILKAVNLAPHFTEHRLLKFFLDLNLFKSKCYFFRMNDLSSNKCRVLKYNHF